MYSERFFIINIKKRINPDLYHHLPHCIAFTTLYCIFEKLTLLISNIDTQGKLSKNATHCKKRMGKWDVATRL